MSDLFSLYFHILPRGLTKLPASIQLFLLIAVAAHVIAVAVMIALHCTRKNTPNFKGKII